MAINWFPGHMHKARKEIKKVMAQVDLVVEVLDARIPFSSANPLVKSLADDKPCIKLLNKADLADPGLTRQWQEYFEKDVQVKTLALSANSDARGKVIGQLCRKMVPDHEDSDRPIRVMIMGIPNVGKSTLINGLAGKSIAKVGNEPAVTKRQQKINLDNGISVLDTPGILWPKLEPESCGYRLAATGAIKDTAMEYEDVAMFTLAYLKTQYVEALTERYKLKQMPEGELELLEVIGSKRGCLRSGGRVDLYQAATIVLQDFRSGKLGAMTLETPAIMEQELAVLAEQRAALAATKDAEPEGKQPKQSP